MYVLKCDLTIKTAMAPPMMKPAMTSDQWLRYSTTRLIPVRKARHISPRESTGLASRVPLAFTEHVMYIWGRTEHSVIHLHSNHSVNAFHSSFIPCSRVDMFVWIHTGFILTVYTLAFTLTNCTLTCTNYSVNANIWMYLMLLTFRCSSNLIHLHGSATLFHLSKTLTLTGRVAFEG